MRHGNAQHSGIPISISLEENIQEQKATELFPVSSSILFSLHHLPGNTVQSLIKKDPIGVSSDDSLRTAAEIMAKENLDVLPVIGLAENNIIGILS
jgi:predicted transcriptional regulator